MPDMNEAAAQHMTSATQQVAGKVVPETVKASTVITREAMHIVVTVASRTAGGTARAIAAMIDAAHQAGAGRRDEGQVGLKQFTKLTDGKREILPLAEADIAREFARELRRHGVTFAIEKHSDGSRSFHVEGKDSTVVQHALEQAEARVDERIQRQNAARAGRATEGDHQQAADELIDFDVLTDELDRTEEIQLDNAEAESVAETLAEHNPELADQVRQQQRIVIDPVNVSAFDVTASTTTTFAQLPEPVQDQLIHAWAAEPSDLSLAASHEVDLPDRTDMPDAELSLELDNHEKESLVGALQRSYEVETVTLTPEQRTELISGLRDHADQIAGDPGLEVPTALEPAAVRYEQLNSLADQVEQNGTIRLDASTAKIVQDAYADVPTPESLADVVKVAENQLGSTSRQALAEQIDSQSLVTLDHDTTATLHELFGQELWTRGENDHMAWVVGSVNQEYERFAVVPDQPTQTVTETRPQVDANRADAPERGEAQTVQPDNPWLSVEPERADATLSTDNPWLSVEPEQVGRASQTLETHPFAPDEWDRGSETPQQAAPELQPADRTTEPLLEPLGGRESEPDAQPLQPLRDTDQQDLSRRDATRDRVAKKIDTEAQTIKKDRGLLDKVRNRATPRNPKVKR